ncbi:MAG: carbohydrate deacetylase [Bacilli bacterium]
MLKVIMNADDFGLTDGVNAGIIESMENGVVTSATLMATMPGFDDAVQLVSKRNMRNIGLHLNMTSGKPLSPMHEVRSIVDDEGKFFSLGKAREMFPKMDPLHIKREIEAQYLRVRDAGVDITHIDCHHHSLLIRPETMHIVCELAKEIGVPVRSVSDAVRDQVRAWGVSTIDRCCLNFYNEEATMDTLRGAIQQAKADGIGSLEFMLHPAHVDEVLQRLSSYADKRADELVLLTSDEVKQMLRDENVELCDYTQI